MNEIEKYNETMFEEIKHIDENGNEYWEARELQIILGYKEWRYFSGVMEKAQISCSQSNNSINSNFGVNTKIVKTGVSSKAIIDYKLSRYACYLIVQNANPKHKAVALGQTYFAIQTRKMELTEEEYSNLSEDEKRLYRRKQTKDGNKSLYKVALSKGVENFDKFTNAGYKGLYNGETANDIAKRKGIRYREEILDHMGSAELGANVFRITQTSALAKLYCCANGTKSINQAVKRHMNRFPERFMFQLQQNEYYEILRSQHGTLGLEQGQYAKYLPYAFTEQGVAMLATILRTSVAEEVSIKIMDAFVAMRKYISSILVEQ